MRLSTLCIATVLAVGSIGLANAVPVNLVQNGDFSQTTTPKNYPTQFGSKSGTSPYGAWGGQFVTGWTSFSNNSSGYSVWEPNATAATTQPPASQWGSTARPLVASVTAPPVGPGTFIAMDGEPSYSAGVSQMLTGLTKYQTYSVSFYWNATETTKATKTTTEHLQVSFGNLSQNTTTFTNAPGQSSGWQLVTMKFGAHSASELLSFLSLGTPSGEPPMGLLTGVSVYHVPEPASLAMFGGGLLGLGLLIVFARRRELRQRALEDGSSIG